MKGYLGGKPVQLTAQDQLGQGGEGIVFRYGKDEAIKAYHAYDPMREAKLKVMISSPPKFRPGRGTPPVQAFADGQGRIIGFSMALIGKGWRDLSQLANRQYRDQFKPTTRDTAKLFLDGGETLASLHKGGYCVGDFSDANEQFQGIAMLFVDVDAYQFGKFPCPVGTEAFLDPKLYGIDLSLRPVFTAENDWYSYAVLLFRSMLGVHPYGGTHRTIKQLTQRAQQGITVLDSGVVYPKMGLPPAVLSDDLLHAFHQVFKDGHRGFSQERLRHYADEAQACPNCGTTYARERRQCPACNAVPIIPVAVVQKGIEVEEIYMTIGTILFSKVIGDTITVIEENGGLASLYEKAGDRPPQRFLLERYEPGARYEIGSQYVVGNQRGSDTIAYMLRDGAKFQHLKTDVFAGTKRAMFRVSEDRFFRIAAGSLMEGRMQYSKYVERPLRPALENQTWFAVRQDSREKPTVCGFMQVFREQHWFLYYEGRNYDGLALTPLEVGEVQTDVLVRFDSYGVLILRATTFRGAKYLHSAVVRGSDGKVENASRQPHDDDLPHGALYAHGAFIYPTDDGLVQQKLDGSEKTFAQTKGVVEAGDTLYEASNGGIIVVKKDRVLRIQLR